MTMLAAWALLPVLGAALSLGFGLLVEKAAGTRLPGLLLMIVGVQVLALGLCAHAYGTYFMGERDPWFDRMRGRFRLEHGLMLGGGIVFAATLVVVGIQIFFSSFLLSILGLRRRDS